MLSPFLIIDSVNVDAKLYSYPFRCVCIFEIRKLENKVRHTVGSKGRTSGIYPFFFLILINHQITALHRYLQQLLL